MENFILELISGDTINEAAKEAKSKARSLGGKQLVEFDFNSVTCIVNDETVVDWLVRDYMNAHIMEWKTIGPECVMQYDVDTEIELYTRKLASAKRRKKAIEKQEEEDNSEKAKVDEMVKGVTLLIWPGKVEEYKEYVELNSKDGYGKCVIDYSEYWAKLMQVEMAKGRTDIKDIADETQKPLGFLGITGFMYACAVKGLSHFWQFGEELRKWHNKEYGQEGDGVVNPAIMTISTE